MLAVAAVVNGMGDSSIVSAFSGFAIACPCILYLWQMRRACYVEHRPFLAVSGGSAYLACVLACVCALRYAGLLGPGMAAAGLGLSSLAAGAFLAWRLGCGWPSLSREGRLGDVWATHWAYGRWAAAAAVASWVSANLFTLLVPLHAGLEGAGALTALVSLIMPTVQIETALSLLLLPALTERRGRPAFRSTVRFAVLTCGAAATLQWLVFGLSSSWLVGVIYGHSYDRYAPAIWILGLIPVFYAVTSALGTAHRALERPRRVFTAHAVSAVVAVAGGWALVLTWGFEGAAVGCALSYAAAAIVLGVSWTSEPAAIIVPAPTPRKMADAL
jgi:O-antigen/teichoic acid export membrane protein